MIYCAFCAFFKGGSTKSAPLSLSKILFDKLRGHFQNFHKSFENVVIENERHP